MHRNSSSSYQDIERLAQLAMNFRGTRQDDQLRAIANDYALTVERLIESRNWHDVPSFEDQLPDEWMPKTFYDYWAEQAGS